MSLTPWEPSRLPRSTKISTKRIAAAPIVLFDGACNLCNGAVRFIIERDPRCLFRFASLQSPAGADLARHHGFPGDQLRTVALIDGGRIYTRSSAALRIARQPFRTVEAAHTFRRRAETPPRRCLRLDRPEPVPVVRHRRHVPDSGARAPRSVSRVTV